MNLGNSESSLSSTCLVNVLNDFDISGTGILRVLTIQLSSLILLCEGSKTRCQREMTKCLLYVWNFTSGAVVAHFAIRS